MRPGRRERLHDLIATSGREGADPSDRSAGNDPLGDRDDRDDRTARPWADQEADGAFHLRRLIRDRVAGKPLAKRIAAAYVIGWPVSLDHDLPTMGLPACTAPDQAGCVMSWISYAEPADNAMLVKSFGRRPGLDGETLGASAFLCTNPLTGGAAGEAKADANFGTLVPDVEKQTGKLIPKMVPARCGDDGFLYIGDPPDLGPYVLPGNNYHLYDIPLFWANLRADVAGRVKAWKPAR